MSTFTKIYGNAFTLAKNFREDFDIGTTSADTDYRIIFLGVKRWRNTEKGYVPHELEGAAKEAYEKFLRLLNRYGKESSFFAEMPSWDVEDENFTICIDLNSVQGCRVPS